eukprot:CAMPEP_0203832660 /NCGR_PEP_ID=MMETSP0115-20131106/71293_1 /ASSEMBLY_ACC=CAM_ASM_000227 /TAXON_ID=33651 /ORGANISM="Bicosoecid sp, Strain ms1" /LENGTH=38 /DNA_ID= /DNA_START= /DNA_END= /DNA_ORIENTATION=
MAEMEPLLGGDRPVRAPRARLTYIALCAFHVMACYFAY